jgi:hypothetical protein
VGCEGSSFTSAISHSASLHVNGFQGTGRKYHSDEPER